MKRYQFITLSVLLTLLIGVLLIDHVDASPLLGSGAPTVVSYQGVVKENGAPYSGTGYFKFALVDTAGTTSYWSNDGTSTGGGEPTSFITLQVENGLFQVLLGDTNITNMIALPASAFNGTERSLRIWFSAGDIIFTQLNPDQPIAAVPFALQAEEAQFAADADTLDGLDSTDLYTRAELDVILADQNARITELETLLASVTLENDGKDLVFTAVNVHVRSGSGATYEEPNGVGNLIVGYNEDEDEDAVRNGSHNLVLGVENSYTSFGGFVAGERNAINGPYAAVSAGYGNTASGSHSSVSGGSGNTASSSESSVSGGYGNTANGNQSSVSGGQENTASGSGSSVSGGYDNTASGFWSSVSGGSGNLASWTNCSVSGGTDNEAHGINSSVSGGYGNLADGESSSISGGYLRAVTGMHDWAAGSLWQDD